MNRAHHHGILGIPGRVWGFAATLLLLICANLPGAAQAQTSVFTTQTPVLASASDGVSYELGMKFRAARTGRITAIRFWKSTGDTGVHVGRLWSSTGALLGSVTFSGETASGWQQQALATSVAISANVTYVVSVNIVSNYPFTGAGLAASIVNGDLSTVADGANGVFGASGTFPSGSFNNANYFRDVVFVPDTTGTPTKLSLSPATANTQSGVPVTYTATIQDANGNTLTTATNPVTFTATGLTGTFSPSSLVAPASGVATATFTPSASGTGTIAASATGLTGSSGSLTVAVASTTSQTLFTTQTPASASVSDGVPYELGMKFRAGRSGQITALRFYKAIGDTTTHVGRLWSATGTLLGSVTFAGETASGWQQQTLASPIPIQANTTYVVSANVGGNFPMTRSGLATAVTNGDLSSVADGANGVFGSPFAFPSTSFSSSNYFRDVVFVPDTVSVPTKLGLTGSATTTQIGVPVTYTATVQDASGNAVTTASNTVIFSISGVSGTFSPNTSVVASAGTAFVTFTPTSNGSATVSASAVGLSGATLPLAVSRSSAAQQTVFTTQVPALGDASDNVPYELGMKFQVARAGQITAVRYWKAPSDTGTHVGRLWSATGTLLASVAFANETASGWQTQQLEVPVAVAPSTTYVVSVNVTKNYAFTLSGLTTAVVNGDISSVADGANGVFGTAGAFPTGSYRTSNYFRDVVFVADTFGAATKLALIPGTVSTQTGMPVNYTAVVQDANGNVVSTATNPITFSVAGVTGAFDPVSPIAPAGGIASTAITATTTGTATITASATGLTSATSTMTVTQGSGAPAVISENPYPGATGIAVSTAITVTFNQSVLAGSIAFTLTDSAGNSVPATLSYDDVKHVAKLQPTAPLQASSVYTANITAAMNSAGQTLQSPLSWSFTTGSGNLGQWSPVYTWPNVSIHTHLMPDGKVLSWADDDTTTRNAGFTKAYVVDIPTDGPPGAVQYVPNTTTNVFCSGHTFLPDGRLITLGGHQGQDQYGSSDIVIFETRNGQYGWFQQTTSMNAGRWYPTVVGLSNGDPVVFAGSEITGVENPLPQVWLNSLGGGLRDLSSAQRVLPWYSKTHLAPNGKLFVAGPEQFSRYLDAAGTGAWIDLAPRLYGNRDYGSSAMYGDGKILYTGGGDPPTATAEIIDLTSPTPTWQWTGQMQFARRQMNLTILPDGKLFATGGTSSPGFNDATNAVLESEMWDPATGLWSTMASMQVPRLYHSSAILLPDGRVLSAGGGRPAASSGGTDNWNAEIYSPPYLFKGPRPTITSMPSSLAYGQAFTLSTPDAANISDVTLIRLSSVTHSFNMNQRFTRLPFTKATGALNITAPTDHNLVPPGHYLLFILNGNGVPSVAKIVQFQ